MAFECARPVSIAAGIRHHHRLFARALYPFENYELVNARHHDLHQKSVDEMADGRTVADGLALGHFREAKANLAMALHRICAPFCADFHLDDRYATELFGIEFPHFVTPPRI